MCDSFRPLLLERPIFIYGYDIDAMGIVSNLVYIRWFEDLRSAFLEKYYPFSRMIEEGIAPILSKTGAEYINPLRISDSPVGRVWISFLKRSRWETRFEIEVNGKIHCQGIQEGYFFDLKRSRPVPAPPEIHEHYRKALEAEAQDR